MTLSSLLIYGATGYTGQLMVREALRRGLRPIVAGRDRAKVESLARELELHARVFSLDSDTARHLKGITLVLHCAGPFSKTAEPMLQACLAAGVHYADITGEIDVFELGFSLDASFKDRGFTAISGVGFDVVPSDCAAVLACETLGEPATQLDMAFLTNGAPSHGTMRTMLEKFPQGSLIRQEGVLRKVRWGAVTRPLPFGMSGAAIPWGDVSTAYRSTGCPNIRVFIPMPRTVLMGLRVAGFVAPPIVGMPFVQKQLEALVDMRVTGPSSEERQRNRTRIWAEATGASGRRSTVEIRCGDGYDLTVAASLAIADEILAGKTKPGVWTPAQLFGGDLVRRLPDVSVTMS